MSTENSKQPMPNYPPNPHEHGNIISRIQRELIDISVSVRGIEMLLRQLDRNHLIEKGDYHGT